ncbi:STAS domain-containing protein [Mycobacterium sp. MYCO198283]|uniref:STAS domain-containing protein n=1 Tax=Mycobacterium sp. MYCO198283 TaxID=2883505 RepID=UPI001E4C3CA6|nr:STAS domain-containing protein [Mycobacterium sp. MYCO198283]MCG5432064.1 STAS domain-containing protein [Mycobacterium sp. MYCO198283]
MTLSTIGAASKNGFRYGNPALDCDGAEIRTQCRQLATVVSVAGRADGPNLDQLIRHVTRFVLPEKPVVLDLSDITEFAAEALGLFDALEVRCQAVGVGWCLVPNAAVARTVQHHGDAAGYPCADSVPHALHAFSDAINERRRLLPLLTKAV